MTSPKATDVCKRFWLSPLPYFSIILMIIGAIGAISTLATGYYMVYRSELQLGLCFLEEFPGVRRACILDLGGGVVSMVVGVLLLLMELASAYINRKDWKITFFVIKIIMAVIATIVLVAGTIQGAASYAEYCDEDAFGDVYYSYYTSGLNNNFKLCDFSNHERQHDPDVDFLTIVIVTGIGAFSWVVLLTVEIVRLCIVILVGTKGCIPGSATHSQSGHELQQLQTSDHELPAYNDTPSPKHSAV